MFLLLKHLIVAIVKDVLLSDNVFDCFVMVSKNGCAYNISFNTHELRLISRDVKGSPFSIVYFIFLFQMLPIPIIVTEKHIIVSVMDVETSFVHFY